MDLSHHPAADLIERIPAELRRYANTEFRPPRHAEYEGRNIGVQVAVLREEDVTWQFFARKFPPAFDTLLAEVVEAHFGSTDKFAVDWVPEMQSWSLIGRGLWLSPLKNEDHLVAHFLDLLDNALDEVKS